MRNRTRTLALALGLLLVLSGLVVGWWAPTDEPAREPEASLALVEDIVERREEAADIELDDAEPEPEPELSEFDQFRASLDLSDAPEPAPELISREDFDLYVNVTGEYLQYIFDKVGYTGDKIESGETTAIPPLIVVSISKGWADDQTVQYKKSMFYRVLLPLVLYENDAVLAERESLEALATARTNGAPIPAADLEWLRDLALRYKVMKADDPGDVGDEELAELLLRVDMVPPSMALGQAAYESGYATSRFAHTGNALFGQWDWSSDAIKPLEQRSGMGNYGIKAFQYPIDSVRAYLWNLNTHRSYGDFRRLRAEQRGSNQGQFEFDGLALAGTLLAYSERGEAYTKDLQGMMSYNRLHLADRVRLLRGEPIFFD